MGNFKFFLYALIMFHEMREDYCKMIDYFIIVIKKYYYEFLYYLTTITISLLYSNFLVLNY